MENELYQDLEGILKDLCRRNGRYYEVLSSDEVVTAEQYTGEDGQIFPCIESAIEWEKGYITAGTTAEGRNTKCGNL